MDRVKKEIAKNNGIMSILVKDIERQKIENSWETITILPKISNAQKWAKRYSNCKSSLFKALHTPTITWQEVKEQSLKDLKKLKKETI